MYLVVGTKDNVELVFLALRVHNRVFNQFPNLFPDGCKASLQEVIVLYPFYRCIGMIAYMESHKLYTIYTDMDMSSLYIHVPAAERTFPARPGNENVRNTMVADAAMFAPSDNFIVTVSG